jgi:hypothetical protein
MASLGRETCRTPGAPEILEAEVLCGPVGQNFEPKATGVRVNEFPVHLSPLELRAIGGETAESKAVDAARNQCPLTRELVVEFVGIPQFREVGIRVPRVEFY